MNVASLFSARSAPHKLNGVIVLTKLSSAQSGCSYSYALVICHFYFTITIDLNERLKSFILPHAINIIHIASQSRNDSLQRRISGYILQCLSYRLQLVKNSLLAT